MCNKNQVVALLIKNSKAVNTAVKWWSDFLRGNKPTYFHNGDDSLGVSIATVKAFSNRLKKGNVDDMLVDNFESTLKRLLTDKNNPVTQLSVDYGPDKILSKALILSGIEVDNSILPWKTEMNFTVVNDRLMITVSYGYLAEEDIIYN